MPNNVAAKLNFAARATLALAGIATLAVNAPAQAQSTATTPPRFDVASIKPTSQVAPDVQGHGSVRILPGGRLMAETVQLRYFIQNAYAVKTFQISGGPAWIDSAHYDIDATAAGNPNNGQMLLMMQTLLEDRFKLRLHHETQDLPVYELTAAKSGVKLQGPKEGSCMPPVPNGPPVLPAPGQPITCGRVQMGMSPSSARMQGARVSMTDLIRTLSNVLGRTVVDKTGLTTIFDVNMEFTPDDSLVGMPPPPGSGSPGDDRYGTIFVAIQEQLGLKLESTKGPVDVLIIDSVEKPSAN